MHSSKKRQQFKNNLTKLAIFNDKKKCNLNLDLPLPLGLYSIKLDQMGYHIIQSTSKVDYICGISFIIASIGNKLGCGAICPPPLVALINLGDEGY